MSGKQYTCKQCSYPCCTMAGGLSFKQKVGQRTGFHRSRFLRPLCFQCHNEPGSLVLWDFYTMRGCWVSCQELWFVCVVLPVWSEKTLPGWWMRAVCLCPDLQNGWGHRWDLLSGWLFSGPCVSVFGQTWKPWLGWTGISLNGGETLRLSAESCMNRGCERQAEKVGGSVEVRSVWVNVTVFSLMTENTVLQTHGH